MDDIATLGIAIDSSPAVQAAGALDRLTASGGKAEAAAERLAGASKESNNALHAMASALDEVEAGAMGVAAGEDRASRASDELAGSLNRVTGASGSAQGGLRGVASASSEAEREERDAAAAADLLADRIRNLKASADPLGLAIDKVNDELRENAMLLSQGAISADTAARNNLVLSQRMDDLTRRQQAHNTMLMTGTKVARLSTQETLNLTRQLSDVGVTLAMGMNPLMVAIQQGPQIADIMQTSGMGVKGLGVELGVMLGILKRVQPAQVEAAVTAGAQALANEAVERSAKGAAAAELKLAGASGAAAASSTAAAAAATAQAGANAAAGTATAAAGAEAAAGVAAGGVALTGVAIAAAAVVAVVGVLAGAWALAARSINRDIGSNIDHLHLNEQQLERLREEGVNTGVTMGDTFMGLMDSVAQAFDHVLGPTVRAVGSAISEFMDDVGSAIMEGARNMVGHMTGAAYAAKAVWASLPAAISDIAAQIANGIIHAMEGAINFGIRGLNRLMSLGRMVSFMPGMQGFALTSDIDEVEFQGVDNRNAGAAARVMSEGGAAYNEGFGVGRASVDTNIGNRRDARVTEGAGDAGRERRGGSRSGGLSEEARELQRATEAAEQYAEGIANETAMIGQNEIQRKRRQSQMAIDEATEAGVAQSIIDNIADVQQAWEAATIAEGQNELVRQLREINEQTEFETSLQGMNAEQREVANAERQVELILREAIRNGIPVETAAIIEQTDAIRRNAQARGAANQAAEDARRLSEDADHNARLVGDATASFGDLFGDAGEAFGDIMSQWADYEAFVTDTFARIAEVEAEYGSESVEARRERARSAQELAAVEVQHYGDMLSAAKGFFEENSTGYKILQAAEQAYRLYQFAMAVKAMFFDTAETTAAAANSAVRMGTDAAETGSSVANSGIRAAADGVAAFAKTLASLPFPFNIAAGAVVLAALVGVGVAMKGGMGGGKGSSGASNAYADTPTTVHNPFSPTDRPSSISANDNRARGQAGTSTTVVVDLRNADMRGTNPAEMEAAIRRVADQEIIPKAVAESQRQTAASFAQTQRQVLVKR